MSRDDEIRRRGLLGDLTRRLAMAGFDEDRILDHVLLELERIRDGAGSRRWERRLPTGPRDVDRSLHLAAPNPARGVVETLCRGSWPIGNAVETQLHPSLADRCRACWRRAVATSWLGTAIVDLADEIQAEDERKAELQEQARVEMAGQPSKLAVPPASDSFELDPFVVDLGGES